MKGSNGFCILKLLSMSYVLYWGYYADTEASIFKTVVTNNILEFSFEFDCTRVTIKTQISSLTLPKGVWRALEAARHHNLHLTEEKVNG